MADIVITIPKTVPREQWQAECQRAEEKGEELNFRLGARAPRYTAPGDRCYVIHDGAVRGYHTIDRFENKKEFTCTTTGVHWPAGIYVVRRGKFHPVPPVQMSGFQGFRYFEREWLSK